MAIFAGPSRSPDLILGTAQVFPPARAGDLSDAVDSGFGHIVLSDTLFLDAPPNHREIMEVMRRGATMYGCSSAGALDDSYQAVTPSLLEIRYYLGYLSASGLSAEAVARTFGALSSVYYMNRNYDVVRRAIAEHLCSSGLRVARGIEDPAFRIKSIDLENCLADIALSIGAHSAPFRRTEINAAWLNAGLLLRA